MVTKWPDWGNRNPLQTSDDDDDDYVDDDENDMMIGTMMLI